MQSEKIARDIVRWQTTAEGQFFERKSAFDRTTGKPKYRKAADIARDVAETLSAMANADGGELVIGIENDGELTGTPHAEDKIRLIVNVPGDRNYVAPPLPCASRIVQPSEGPKLLHFEVHWSANVHLLSDSRCLLRVRDRNEPFDKDKIKALKEAKGQGLFERTFPAGATIRDLDENLFAAFAEKHRPDHPALETLYACGLLEGQHGQAVPTMAALLLFGKNPQRWHERCGIDFVRWEGKERKSGAELNISKRFSVEAPLSALIERAFDSIKPFIRERQKLHDLFFTEKLEYPTFAWQEAIVNAVAHRDYSIRGLGIEVWMFDDHMEIRSPGLPPSLITLEALAKRQHLHCSRNPLVVRVLTAMGYMRELGEGIPRIFDEMERAGCYPPNFSITGGAVFQVTLRNEPIYDKTTIEWLQKFNQVDLSGDQKRMLAYAHAHGGYFTSREYQKVIGTDIYGASIAIKDMIRKGVSGSTGKGSKYYMVQEPLGMPPEMPADFLRIMPFLQKRRKIRNEDVRKIFKVARNTASRMLSEWSRAGWLHKDGAKRGSSYTPGERLMHQSENAPENSMVGA
jgi:ATP-dependent DNA helicase RecG